MCCVPFQSVHSQEIERLGGLLGDAPKPFHFRDGGGHLLVQLTDYHQGWTNTSGDQKVFKSIVHLTIGSLRSCSRIRISGIAVIFLF